MCSDPGRWRRRWQAAAPDQGLRQDCGLSFSWSCPLSFSTPARVGDRLVAFAAVDALGLQQALVDVVLALDALAERSRGRRAQLEHFRLRRQTLLDRSG